MDNSNIPVNNNPDALKRENRVLMISLLCVVAATIALAVIGFLCLETPSSPVEGQVEANSVKISGKLPGRVVKFYVQEGDMVKAGDTLVHIYSSLAEAKLMQAEGMETAAGAANRKVDAGTRSQIVQSARDLVAQAEAATGIARKTYDRMENLFSQGVVSAQKRDEAKAAYDAAKAGESAARSQLSLALSGAQKEDKEAAAAMVTVARGGVKEVQSLLEDQYLTAPCDGQIDIIYPQEGELMALGAPIMNLLKIDDRWITFNVREELLNDLPLGADVTVKIPALDMKEVKGKVYYVRDMGSYATWRATKSTGDWDSRTFTVKMRPDKQVPELRPGMTALYYHD